MSVYLAGRKVISSGTLAPRATALQAELVAACGKENTAILNLDGLLAGDDSLSPEIEATRQVQAAFSGLKDNVSLFVIDARDLEPSGRDPIWEVPLDEWNQHKTATQVVQQRTLLQVKLLLQKQLSLSKDGATLQPFLLVIVGYRDTFDGALDPVIAKLQRDVTWLQRESSVAFLDLASTASEPTEQSIAAAIGILASSRSSHGVTSINAVWGLHGANTNNTASSQDATDVSDLSIHPTLAKKKPTVKIALSFDFDALSAFLGTGDHPDNNLADYSTGVFSGRVGARRLLRMLQKYQVADKVTWFIPAHTMETFPDTCKEITESGAEIGLHGYAHEGAYQMTVEQERDVFAKCVKTAQALTGKKVLGWRAPMYQLRETSIALLKEFEFLYDSSLSHHDSQPYLTPSDPPVERIDFSKPASSWLKPTPLGGMYDCRDGYPLVEIPIGWNNEDMMALQYYPHVANTNGNVDSRVVEQRWKDIFLWLWENGKAESDDGTFIFPLLMHPDTSGLAHVMAMADRFVGWLRSWGDSVEFATYETIAREFLSKKGMTPKV
ncbi:hypothetical protein SPBR_05826 [Sporothrix brasiliensis 5110]|uniref:NodB homology domain-containing protein n=1 Tax=Sporothrix brasiliensis 5110 TaxID=1398154 RepID=A0A0C2F4L0_9PEZI|nr:uncharacterized protein SPBR_05826 [Sporothrix brasiliensis 5110]KIH93844.1 hypothetical protein SPBR_05826 [Sporothrix brasiliensis 5110]